MYHLRVTVYEGGEWNRVSAELYEGEPDAKSPVVTAHLHLHADLRSGRDRHALILEQLVAVCLELSQNYQGELF